MSWLGEFAATVALLPWVELVRRRSGTREAIESARSRGARRPARSESERTNLRRAISVAERLIPTGPNCFRRVLLEIALDAGAARETVNLGLNESGELGSGHVWLADAGDGKRYDAVIAV